VGGLNSKPELNGAYGLVVSRREDRWGVQLCEPANGNGNGNSIGNKTVFLKAKTLTVVSSQPINTAATAVAAPTRQGKAAAPLPLKHAASNGNGYSADHALTHPDGGVPLYAAQAPHDNDGGWGQKSAEPDAFRAFAGGELMLRATALAPTRMPTPTVGGMGMADAGSRVTQGSAESAVRADGRQHAADDTPLNPSRDPIGDIGDITVGGGSTGGSGFTEVKSATSHPAVDDDGFTEVKSKKKDRAVSSAAPDVGLVGSLDDWVCECGWTNRLVTIWATCARLHVTPLSRSSLCACARARVCVCVCVCVCVACLL
jgi:hypothetical protein